MLERNKLFDILDIFDNAGYNLSRTAAVSNKSHPFAPVVVVDIPPCSMKDLSLEFIHSGKFDLSWLGNATDR